MLEQRTEILAKLMATEDILVQQKNTPTAYFDTKQRTLVLPSWENLSELETEMLICHEIGHALYTPSDAWLAAINSFEGNKSVFKHIMNVVEDPRIERKVKQKYPGSRKIFYFGYEKLYQRGIFSELIVLEKLSLVDKLNLQFKIPGKVQFDTDNVFWDLVRKIESCDTFESVVDLTKEIYLLCEKEDNLSKESEEKGESELLGEGEKIQGKQKSLIPSEKTKNPTNASEEESVESAEVSEKKKEDSFEEKYSSSIQKKIDEFLAENLSKKDYEYFPFPDPILENIIISNADILKIAKEEAFSGGSSDLRNLEEEDISLIPTSIRKFNKTYSSSISYYVKTFMMKKKAKQYKNTLRFKTGKLDMNRLPSYKFEENIFLTTEVQQKGKNHGLVFYLDMSSSMANNFSNTVRQLIEVISFCRQCSIPVSVYGFSDNPHALIFIHNKFINQENFSQFRGKQHFKNEDTPQHLTFALLELFSPKMTTKDFNFMSSLFLSGDYRRVMLFALRSTPLNPAITTIDKIVHKFRKETSAQIINVVFLTDGEDTTNGIYFSKWDTEKILYDPKTKTKATFDKSEELTAAFLSIVKKRLKDVTLTNFFICKNLYLLYGTALDTSDKLYLIQPNPKNGFDEQYLVSSDAFRPPSEKIVYDKISPGAPGALEYIQRRFVSAGNAKKQKRTMIDSFIDKIC